MRDAISLFELCASGGHEVTSDRVTEILGLSGTETAYKTAVAVKKRDTAAVFRIVQTVSSSSRDIAVYWQELVEFWRNMLVCKYLPPEDRAGYLDLTDPEIRVLEDAAKRFDQAALTYHFTILDDAMREMSRSPQTKRLTAELSLIRMCDPSLETTVESLTARVAELESRIALLSAGVPQGGNQPETVPEPMPEKAAVRAEKTFAEPEKTAAETVPSPEKTAEPVPVKKAAEPVLIRDLGEITEKISAANPMYMSFFRDADCYVSPDRKEVTVKAVSSFAVQMLSSDSAKKVLSSAFILCGVCDPDAVLKITGGAVPKEKNLMDELTEF